MMKKFGPTARANTTVTPVPQAEVTQTENVTPNPPGSTCLIYSA
jgi:hypothetical protein